MPTYSMMLGRRSTKALLLASLTAGSAACFPGSAGENDGTPPGVAAGGAVGGGAGSGGSSVAQGGPGRVVMHRLNRVEYDNTVRDLLGTDLRLSENFPPDDTAHGFDNVAAALSMTDVSLGYYIASAKKLAAEALSPSRRDSVLPCELESEQEACVASALSSFLPRAWRRPVEAGEVERLVALYTANKADGATEEEAFARVLQAVLLAPQFLFRVEHNLGSAGVRQLDGYELASRLSYFLWSSMPDDALRQAAANGSLATTAGVQAQVARLLADTKAKDLGERFGSQWLTLRSLDNVHPDAMVYPAFDDELRSAMRAETMRLFADVASGQRPLSELLTTRSGYINDRLAEHYGMPAVGSAEPVLTPLPAERGGLLTHASILTVLAHPKESAPVLRGKWILSQLLCRNMPPPPPDVPQEPAVAAGTSRRERLAAHRVQSACKGCHDQMDPPGLALEQYDGVGAFRTEENGALIDPSGQLSGGTSFSGPQELAQLIAQDPALPRCVAQHLFTYALGRAPRDSGFDAAALDAITQSFVDGGQLFPQLVTAIASSEVFRTREDEEAP